MMHVLLQIVQILLVSIVFTVIAGVVIVSLGMILDRSPYPEGETDKPAKED